MISTRRSYVYDEETGLYYLQSRYYNPEWGRFLNADALVATGQGMLGNNMFAYCRNNPACRVDISGAADADCLDVKGDDEIEIPADDPHFAGRPAAQPGGSGSSSGDLGPAGGGAPNTPSGGGAPNTPSGGGGTPNVPSTGGGSSVIPPDAFDVYNYIMGHNGSPPPGYKGGGVFNNDGRNGGQQLPGEYAPYHEYDIYPKTPGVSRGLERIVIGVGGRAWYTPDHYMTFYEMGK